MAKNKLTVEFEGFDEVLGKLKKLDSDIKGVTEQALEKSKRHVHVKLGLEMKKHNQTYKTVKSLDNGSNVEWAGSIGKIPVGFNIEKGGLPSIFLMYGTPRMNKDQKLWAAIWGTKTKKEIMQIQENLFYEELRRLGG